MCISHIARRRAAAHFKKTKCVWVFTFGVNGTVYAMSDTQKLNHRTFPKLIMWHNCLCQVHILISYIFKYKTPKHKNKVNNTSYDSYKSNKINWWRQSLKKTICRHNPTTGGSKGYQSLLHRTLLQCWWGHVWAMSLFQGYNNLENIQSVYI